MGLHKASGSFFIKPRLNTKKQKPPSQVFQQPSSSLPKTSLQCRTAKSQTPRSTTSRLDKQTSCTTVMTSRSDDTTHHSEKSDDTTHHSNSLTTRQDKTEYTLELEVPAVTVDTREAELSPPDDLTELELCRSWLNNFCDRGDNCKFKHLTDLREIMKVKRVCMAYQQPWGCKSDTCYYIHLTRKERRAIIEGTLKRENFDSDLEQRFFHRPPPICKGECWGYSCKFRHIIGTGKDRQIVSGAQMNSSTERKRKTDPISKPEIKTYYDPSDILTADAVPLEYKEKICRSWVNHFCYKKDKCKLIHPSKDFSFLLDERKICRDWQRDMVCRFKKCKFLHATKAEVELLKKCKLRRDNFTPDQKYRFFGQKMTKEEEMLHKEGTSCDEADDEEVIRKKKRPLSYETSNESPNDCNLM